jgi:SAM-dependent methyltransferase
MPVIQEVVQQPEVKKTNKKKKKKKKKKNNNADPMAAPVIKIPTSTYLALSGGRKLPSGLMIKIRQLVQEQDPRVIYILQNENATLDLAFDPVIQDLETIWLATFRNMSTTTAKHLSTAGREKVSEVNSGCLVYGEVDFTSLSKVFLRSLDLKDARVFYDVGSGSGRGVFAGALIHGFSKLKGIEIVPELYEASMQQLALYNEEILPQLQQQAAAENRQLKRQDISFECQDFRKVDWSDADVVWANSTCFDQDLMRDLSRQSEKMKEGSYFVSLTKGLTSDHWELATPRKLYKMSWGEATIHAHVKIRGPNTPEEEALRALKDAQEREEEAKSADGTDTAGLLENTLVAGSSDDSDDELPALVPDTSMASPEPSTQG